jgi:hypothetical protein
MPAETRYSAGVAACLICQRAPRTTGVLCDECVALVCGISELCAEQIVHRVSHVEDAALLDRWGRVHRLGARTLLGRRVDDEGIVIADGSVSRRHAELTLEPDGRFRVEDLGSSNGTSVNDVPVNGPTELTTGDVLFVGQVGMFFVAPAPVGMASVLPLPTRPPRAAAARIGAPDLPHLGEEVEDDDLPLETFLGLRTVELSLVEPSGGGGGIVEMNGRSAQVTLAQLELMRQLAARMTSEQHQDERVRGFVRGGELLASLSWDTSHPEDNHLKQLVRRVRRVLVRAGLGDLIESRHGFGYRLRVNPSSTAAVSTAPPADREPDRRADPGQGVAAGSRRIPPVKAGRR